MPLRNRNRGFRPNPNLPGFPRLPAETQVLCARGTEFEAVTIPMSDSAFICCSALGLAMASPSFAAKPAVDLVWLDRIGMGADGTSATELESLGEGKFLDRQLGPEHELPEDVRSRIESMEIQSEDPLVLMRHRDSLSKLVDSASDDSAKARAHRALGDWRNGVLFETVQRHLLRDLYSPDGLRERMAWFWGNHFSVFSGKDEEQLLLADYEDRALRPHALGRFRDLVLATLTHPAMLTYLDNAQNAVGHINENYARELLELHTLGVNGGYSQQDVQSLAVVLTGVGVNWRRGPNANRPPPPGTIRDGAFEFNLRRHDTSSVVLLGTRLRGGGFEEVQTAVDILCRHPATAKHLSRRLAEYFLGAPAPAGLVDRMATTFRKTDGDISAVLRTFFLSPESHSPGALKDPHRFVVGALRQAYEGRILSNLRPVAYWLNQLGEPLYGRLTPDGYPLDGEGWSSEGQMVKRFEVARAIGSGPGALFDRDPGVPSGGGFPLFQRPFFWKWREPLLGANTRSVLDQAKSPQEWNLLWMSSPEAMRD